MVKPMYRKLSAITTQDEEMDTDDMAEIFNGRPSYFPTYSGNPMALYHEVLVRPSCPIAQQLDEAEERAAAEMRAKRDTPAPGEAFKIRYQGLPTATVRPSFFRPSAEVCAAARDQQLLQETHSFRPVNPQGTPGPFGVREVISGHAFRTLQENPTLVFPKGSGQGNLSKKRACPFSEEAQAKAMKK